MNILDGDWGSTPNAITVTIPVDSDLFFPKNTHAAQLGADLVAGTAARLAREEFLARVEDSQDG